ncbi:MAG: helix-turn-helix domain-containing protein [Ruminococcus sp.]|nr:helix-turn-helix domain-containing protein [Ruminococcus sp.]
MADKELRELFASNLKYWLERRGKTQADLRRYMEVSSATASDWCNGRKIPRTDKINAICDWLEIDLDDLLTDKSKGIDEPEPYYLNDETRKLAQFLFDNPGHRVLLDASRNLRPEDLDFVLQMVKRMQDQEN